MRFSTNKNVVLLAKGLEQTVGHLICIVTYNFEQWTTSASRR